MPFTPVSVVDTINSPSGDPAGFAMVVAYPRMGFANGGVTAQAASAVADETGAFTLVVSATDDAGTDITDPAFPAGQQPFYRLQVFVAISGEHLFDRDVFVPSMGSPTTIADLPVTS